MGEQELTLVDTPDTGDTPEYYANVVRAVSNVYDFTILFGRGRPVGLSGNFARTDPVCAVHMSPSHAKSLYLILRKQLRNYEEKWGELPVPPEIGEEFGGDIDG